MREKVILPDSYCSLLVLKAKEENIIDVFPNFYDEVVRPEDVMGILRSEAKPYMNQLQKMYQLLLLYGDIIMPRAVPMLDYKPFNNIGFQTHFLEFDCGTYGLFDADSEASARLLKPIVIKRIEGIIRQRLPETLLTHSSDIMALANYYYGLFIEKKELSLRDLSNTAQIMSTHMYNPLEADFHMLVIQSFSELCWLLDTSVSENAFLYNTKYDLSLMGVDESTAASGLNSYQVLKCEFKNLFHQLPGFSSLREVIEVREKKKGDLKSLREEISALNELIENSGSEIATKKAVNDLQKAMNSVTKGLHTIDTVGSATTIMGLPLALASEIGDFSFLGPLGIAVSFLGVSSLYLANRKKAQNGWIEVIR